MFLLAMVAMFFLVPATLAAIVILVGNHDSR